MQLPNSKWRPFLKIKIFIINKGMNQFLEHLLVTEKFSFGWESNYMPLTFWVSTLTIRPLRPPISHCPSILPTCLFYQPPLWPLWKMRNPSSYLIFSRMLIRYYKEWIIYVWKTNKQIWKCQGKVSEFCQWKKCEPRTITIHTVAYYSCCMHP